MDIACRHFVLEDVRRGNSQTLKIIRDALLNKDEVRQLLIEMARKQEQCIFLLVLMGLERALAKTADRESGPKSDA
jgi:hypothetical protein